MVRKPLESGNRANEGRYTHGKKRTRLVRAAPCLHRCRRARQLDSGLRTSSSFYVVTLYLYLVLAIALYVPNFYARLSIATRHFERRDFVRLEFVRRDFSTSQYA